MNIHYIFDKFYFFINICRSLIIQWFFSRLHDFIDDFIVFLCEVFLIFLHSVEISVYNTTNFDSGFVQIEVL